MPKRKRTNTDGKDGTKDDNVKYHGVSKRGKRFEAYVYIDGKLHYLGTFDTSKEAAQAYDRAAIQARLPTSTLNFHNQVSKTYKPQQRKLRFDNTIGYRGVSKSGNRFQAQIRIGGKVQYIGSFGTTKEAAIAYDLAAIQAKRSKSDLNFPDMIHVDVKYKGVRKSGKRFRADTKDQYLGMFDTSKEAAEAHDRARIEAGHPISTLNFLDQVPKNYKPKKKKLSSNNTIGYRGVCKSGGNSENRFQAQININGRRRHLGYFDTIKEAAIAFDLAAIQAKRPTSNLNFPDMIHIKKKIQKRKKRTMMKSSNQTSYNGVSKNRKKFIARIYFNGKGQHLGTFTRARDAAIAYDTAAVELSGKSIDEVKSLLNFPNGMVEEEEEEEL